VTGEPASALATGDLSIVNTKHVVNSSTKITSAATLTYSSSVRNRLAGKPLGWSLPYKFDASKTQESCRVVTELYQVLYKNVCAE